MTLDWRRNPDLIRFYFLTFNLTFFILLAIPGLTTGGEIDRGTILKFLQHTHGDSLGRPAVQFGWRGCQVLPLAGSSPASPGQAPPLVLLLLLPPLADRWRDESHMTVGSDHPPPVPFFPEQTHSPLVPPPLQPAQVPLLLLVGLLQLGQLDAVLHLHGVQPVHRHLAVELNGRGGRGRGDSRFLSHCPYFREGGVCGSDLLASHRFLLPLPPAVFLVGVQRSRQVDVRLLLNGLQQDLLAGRQQTVQAHQLHLCTGRISVQYFLQLFTVK